MIHGGPHHLNVPGPSTVPDRVVRAMAAPVIDHRGPTFAALTQRILGRIGKVFATTSPVVVFPSSGTGAWEASLVNTLSPGDRVLAFETGHFATLWARMAEGLGLEVVREPGDWRHGVDPDVVHARLSEDTAGSIRAVLVVHNETSTGVTSRLSRIRDAMDAAGHDALLLVDAVSSVGSIDYRHDEWRVDVTIAGSQKGLMLPPGLGFNALSEKALAASRRARFARSYWDWGAILEANERGGFPYTPPTTLLYGLDEALDLLEEEGRDHVLARHARLAGAVRAAVRGWGLEVVAANEAEASATTTAVFAPEGFSADRLRAIILEECNLSLGAGLGKLRDRVFRIGHLGHTDEVTILGVLAGVQLGLTKAGVHLHRSGLLDAMDHLTGTGADPA